MGSAGSAAGRAGLLEQLLAAVRPQFRVDVLVPDPDDPVLGHVRCLVESCDRPVHEHGICSGHSGRWRKRGCPDLAEFVADPGPALRGRTEPAGCTVAGCRYGASSKGLCARHRDKWIQAGRPAMTAWVPVAPSVGSDGHNECGLSFCRLWTDNGRHIFCQSHMTRWRNSGCPDVDEFTAGCERYAQPSIDFRGLPMQLRLELQFAIQRRHDERKAAAPPRVIRLAVRQAAESGASSLLELSEDQWRERCARHYVTGDGGLRKRVNSLLLYAREAMETLRDGSGWEVEYDRDVWRLWKLPGLKTSASRPRPRSHLRFDRLTQSWLRELAKRWVRWRLVSGLSVATAVTDVQALTRFSEFLAAAAPDVDTLGGINRPLLERYLAWLKGAPGGTSANEGRVGALHLFFQAIRQHGWDDSLPTSAAFFTGDFPRRRQRVTRYLAEHVMAQIELPANLDRWPYPGRAGW